MGPIALVSETETPGNLLYVVNKEIAVGLYGVAQGKNL